MRFACFDTQKEKGDQFNYLRSALVTDRVPIIEGARGLRLSVRRGRPYGNEAWQQRMAKCLGFESALRPRGRPRKEGRGQ